MRDIVQFRDDTSWDATGDGALTHDVESVIEHGGILCFPRLRFELTDDEVRLLDANVADGKAKNISLRGADDDVRGANPARRRAATDDPALPRAGHGAGRTAVPHYRVTSSPAARRTGGGRRGPRHQLAQGRHAAAVDSFPSNPMHGDVCACLQPQSEVSRAAGASAKPFEDFARRFLPAIPRPLPAPPAVLHALHITKSRRSA
jgi:hypothetical protein